VAERQPIKLAAMEGLSTTERGAPLHVGGIYRDGRLRYAIEIPFGLSLLAHWDPHAVIRGLDSVPASERPPVTVVHLAFNAMVGAGVTMLAISVWFAVGWRRRRGLPRSRWFLRAAVLAGPLSVVALEAGWVTTEVGRQPWIVYGILRTSDAVSSAPRLRYGLYAMFVVYAALTAGAAFVLRRMARRPLAEAPQEPQEVARG
jgi:cytochrome d ubiquinol oxidase subunit I